MRRGVALGAEHEALLVGVGRELALGGLRKPRGERLLGVLGGEADVDAPVLHRVERGDLALALDDQAHRDGLHPPGRQPRLHALPEQGGDLVADEPVEDASCLLRVEQVPIDVTRVRERVEDRVTGDLGERHAARLLRILAQDGRHVMGDRLALAIEVGRQDEPVGRLHGPLQDGDVVRGLVRDLVLDPEIVLGIDAELGLGQIADMPVGGTDHVVRTQVLLDRFRLGRRLDHHECLAHTVDSFTRKPGRRSNPRLGAGRYHRPRNTGEPPTIHPSRLVRFERSRWSPEVFPLLAVFTDTVQRLVADNGYLAVFLLMLLGSMCINRNAG